MTKLKEVIEKAAKQQLSLQHEKGYWWYTLEATEYICVESILLMYYLNALEPKVITGLVRRILDKQREDGTWALYHDGIADLSTTIECYWAVKLFVTDPRLKDEKTKIDGTELKESLEKAKNYIVNNGGIPKSRIFTKIHLALFGLIPWHASPAMPVELILLPSWSPVNVYEFSSWARACIIPLLVVLNKKPVRKLCDNFNLDELCLHPLKKSDWGFHSNKPFFSTQQILIKLDKIFKFFEKFPCPFDRFAIKKCEKWICEHIEKTEDIFPALAYGAMALNAIGHDNNHPIIKKALKALRFFRQEYNGRELPAVPFIGINSDSKNEPVRIHQQCCISPVWDTPWQITALLDSGTSADDPRLIKAGEWLISKQIKNRYGDWKIKNKKGKPGGWSFEFENEYFPDVDDTIQVVHVLNRLKIDPAKKNESIKLGLEWILSMQNSDNGWAAFDIDNNKEIVNRIPFSDHGACLDPSSPDITARVIKLLCELNLSDHKAVTSGIDYLIKNQEASGAWRARWGINYIYGTWTVLTALSSLKRPHLEKYIKKGVDWLKSIQHKDGGWSESPETYHSLSYQPYPRGKNESSGVVTQTSWALMGLVAAGEKNSDEVKKGLDFLLSRQNADGTWNEEEFTGTGFPNHFYIRYHGYRHFFPLLALGKYSL